MSALNRRSAYQWYSGTDFWLAKRNEAMARAKGVCQRCGERRATEVHHLTYERVFNEMAADLLPVCSPLSPRDPPPQGGQRQRTPIAVSD